MAISGGPAAVSVHTIAPDTSHPDDTSRLLEFLSGRDVPCPGCGYNLRDLTEPVCPECRRELALSVGFRRLPLVWLVVTITPGLFSVVAAALMFVPLTLEPLLSPNPPAPWPLWATDAFGWFSGLAALVIVRHRDAFLRQPERRQRAWAAAVWLIHVAAFAAFVAVMRLL